MHTSSYHTITFHYIYIALHLHCITYIVHSLLMYQPTDLTNFAVVDVFCPTPPHLKEAKSASWSHCPTGQKESSPARWQKTDTCVEGLKTCVFSSLLMYMNSIYTPLHTTHILVEDTWCWESINWKKRFGKDVDRRPKQIALQKTSSGKTSSPKSSNWMWCTWRQVLQYSKCLLLQNQNSVILDHLCLFIHPFHKLVMSLCL